MGNIKLKTIGIITARMEATRLPGKMLRLLGERTVLEWALERAGQSGAIDELVVATSTAAADNQIAELCGGRGIACFRGSVEDVLGRFAGAAREFGADRALRICADNPFIDPAYLDQLIEFAGLEPADYTSFAVGEQVPIMLSPIGFFAELLSRACVERADEMIADPFEREHVTLGIYQRPQEFDVKFLSLPAEFAPAELRFTLDTAEDLRVLAAIAESIGPAALTATAEEFVAAAMANPEWLTAMAAQNQNNPKSNRE